MPTKSPSSPGTRRAGSVVRSRCGCGPRPCGRGGRCCGRGCGPSRPGRSVRWSASSSLMRHPFCRYDETYPGTTTPHGGIPRHPPSGGPDTRSEVEAGRPVAEPVGGDRVDVALAHHDVQLAAAPRPRPCPRGRRAPGRPPRRSGRAGRRRRPSTRPAAGRPWRRWPGSRCRRRNGAPPRSRSTSTRSRSWSILIGVLSLTAARGSRRVRGSARDLADHHEERDHADDAADDLEDVVGAGLAGRRGRRSAP